MVFSQAQSASPSSSLRSFTDLTDSLWDSADASDGPYSPAFILNRALPLRSTSATTSVQAATLPMISFGEAAPKRGMAVGDLTVNELPSRAASRCGLALMLHCSTAR